MVERNQNERVQVAIVGAGPSGIGTAIGLSRNGIKKVLLLDRWDHVGGVAGKYHPLPGMVPTYIDYSRARVIHGQQFVEQILGNLQKTEVELRLEATVLSLDATNRRLTVVDPKRGKYTISADAIVFATGAREQNIWERGWITGLHSARVLYTMQLLQLISYLQNNSKALNWTRSVVAGSDLIAYLAAVKLKLNGVNEICIVDNVSHPKAKWFHRLYFRRWVKPEWHSTSSLTISLDNKSQLQIQLANKRCLSCDALIVSGNLIPNSELLIEAGLDVDLQSGVPRIFKNGQLSASGCFITGNLIGGFHGGWWCYHHGLHVAKKVLQYLRINRNGRTF